MKTTVISLCAAALVLTACSTKSSELTKSGLDKAKFETTVDSKKTDLYVLKNAEGMEVCLTNYGGRIVSLMVPDKT